MKREQGFTLIELLIVIGVLGILAAGLLAAIDPFEQLKKGRDANTRNQVVELHNSLVRYYATHGDFPWFETPVTCTNGASSLPAGTAMLLNSDEVSGCVDPVEDDGELKSGFVDAMRAASRTYVRSASRTSLTVCFEPESKSVYYDSNTMWTSAGVDNSATCTLANKKTATYAIDTHNCYWCAK